MSGWVNSTTETSTPSRSEQTDESVGLGEQSFSLEGSFHMDMSPDMNQPADWGDIGFTSPDSVGTDEWKTFENEPLQSCFNHQAEGENPQVEAAGLSPSIWDTGFDVLEAESWEDPSLLNNSNAVFEVVAEYTSILGDQVLSSNVSEDGTGHVEETKNLTCQSPRVDTSCLGSPSLSQEIDLIEPSKLFLLRHCKWKPRSIPWRRAHQS